MEKRKNLRLMLFAIIIMTIAILPGKVSAYVDGKLTYEINGDEVRITDCEEDAVSVEIPSMLQGRPVTEIAEEAFNNCKNLETVTIPEGVESIGREAFYNCTSLTSIVLPDSVTSIGLYLFHNCNKLESIQLSSKIQEITEGAFYNCTSLKNINLPDNLTEIYAFAFENCTSLENIVLGEKITDIKTRAFQGCSSLKSINIPKSLTYLSQGIFAGCTNLQDMTILPTVTEIMEGSFEGEYENLKLYVVRGSIAEEYAIKNNIPFELYELPEKEAELTFRLVKDEITGMREAIVIGGDKLATKATIPSLYKGYPVTQIEDEVFKENLGLKSVMIPEGVREVRKFLSLYQFKASCITRICS